MVRFIALLCLCLFGCSPVNKLIKSNVALTVEGRVFCSGAAISEKHILTAAHCVDDKDFVVILDGEVIAPTVVIKINKTKDLALLEVVGLKPHRLTPVPIASSISLDQEVINVGNPRGVVDVVSHGRICKLNTPDWYGQRANVLCGFAWYGSSGSGIYSTSGALVGILVQVGIAGIEGGATSTYIVPLDVIHKFLEME